MTRRNFAAGILALGAPVSAQDKQGGPLALVSPSTDVILPHMVAGGGWRTTFHLVNLGTTVARYTMIFAGPDGRQVSRDIPGLGRFSQVSGELQPFGSVVIDTRDTGELQQGYVLLLTNGSLGNMGQVGGYAVLRNTVPGMTGGVGAQYEATIPFAPFTQRRFRVPFSATNDEFVEAVAVVNVAELEATLTVTGYAEGGQRVMVETFTMPARTHESFELVTRFPRLRGFRGMVEMASSQPLLSAMGLRFNTRTRAFTSLPPLSLLEWTY